MNRSSRLPRLQDATTPSADGEAIPVKVLIALPFKKYAFDVEAAQAKISARVEKVFDVEWDKVHLRYSKSQCGRRDRQIAKGDLWQRLAQDAYQSDFKINMALILWDKSERILNLLRTKGLHSPPDPEKDIRASRAFYEKLDLHKFPEADKTSSLYIGPTQIANGSPDGQTITIPNEGLVEPNYYYGSTQKELIWDYGYPFCANYHLMGPMVG